MIELSIFTGAGGGLLATSHLLGWTCVGAVEIDGDRCDILERRRQEGNLDAEMDIFEMDIAEFNTRCAKWYRGKVDCVTGGDPCQSNSTAAPRGRRAPSLGADFIRTLEIVQPPFVWRENPAVTRKAAPWPASRFIDELERLGYAVVPAEMRACCLGGHHQRRRLFLLGFNAEYASFTGLEATEAPSAVRTVSWPRPAIDSVLGREESSVPWVLSEADVSGAINEVAARVVRARAIGDGIDPIVAATAWRLLTEDG